MMSSLVETSLWRAARNQYAFKLRAYANLFVSLIAVQAISLLFTVGGMVGSGGMGSNNFYVEVKCYSAAGLLGFTVFWILANAFILTLPLYRNPDFTFVTNRLSSNLANAGFLATAAAGGVSTALGSILLRNIAYYAGGSGYLSGTNFQLGAGELFTGMAVTILYLLLSGAAGYFLGALMQLHRSLYVIVPALLMGLFFYETANEHVRIFRALDFIFLERSPLLFTLKTAAAVLLLWFGAILLTNRAEVR